MLRCERLLPRLACSCPYQCCSPAYRFRGKQLKEMEKDRKRIVIQGDDDLHVENVFIEEMWSEDILEDSIPVRPGERIEILIE